jgi:hypothetical protein
MHRNAYKLLIFLMLALCMAQVIGCRTKSKITFKPQTDDEPLTFLRLGFIEVFEHLKTGAKLLYHPSYGRRLSNEQLQAVEASLPKPDAPAFAESELLYEHIYERANHGRYLVLGQEGALDMSAPIDLINRSLVRCTFYVQFLHQGDTVRNVLPFTHQQDEAGNHRYELTISQKAVYVNAKGKPIPQYQVMDSPLLYCDYITAENQQAHRLLIGVFEPIFIDDESLIKAEVKEWIATSTEQNKEILYEVIKSRLTERYGTPIDTNLKAWLAEHFQF